MFEWRVHTNSQHLGWISPKLDLICFVYIHLPIVPYISTKNEENIISKGVEYSLHNWGFVYTSNGLPQVGGRTLQPDIFEIVEMGNTMLKDSLVHEGESCRNETKIGKRRQAINGALEMVISPNLWWSEAQDRPDISCRPH